MLTFALLAAALIWGLLVLVGDVTGAAGARLAALILAVGWGLDFVALVALLAWDRASDQNGR